jgi:hypothetical protein
MRDRGVGATVDRDRLADSRAEELSVVMRDRGVGAAVEADREKQRKAWLESSVAMRDRGVGENVEADKDRQHGWRAFCSHEGQGCRGGCGGRQRQRAWLESCLWP